MTAIHTLVIGYGNRLRGDDGVGPVAADIVHAWQIPGVKVLAVQQLVPELVEELLLVRRVLFIDAATGVGDISYKATMVEPRKSRRSLGHHETPENLLALAHDLEGSDPAAWLLMLPAFCLEHGEAITADAQEEMAAALTWVRTWLERDVAPLAKPLP